MNQHAAGPAQWTYDEYARLPDDGDRYEIIRGEVCVTPGPRPRHQWVSARLQRLLGDYVEAHGLGVILDDVDLLFSTGEFLHPDLLWVPRDRLAGITTRGVECAPGLVVEVLSPGSETVDRGKKPVRYGELGVPEYWLADPQRNVLELFRRVEATGSIAEPRVVTDRLEWHPDPRVPPLVAEVPPLFAGW